MNSERILSCPVCNSTNFQSFLTCEDYTVTHEHFELQECISCKFVVTNPRPGPNSISDYYQSGEYISHTGAGKGLLPWLYLTARKFTLRWKVNIVKRYNPKPRILDYGCGTGEFLHQCSAEGFTISGIEPSLAARTKATALTGINIAADIAQLGSQKFDVITLWHVLEHIMDLNQKIRSIKELLAENGTLLIAVPNHESADAARYKAYWAGYDVPRHLWHFSPASMNAFLRSAGLNIRHIIPMKLDAYYVAILSQKYKSPRSPGIANMLKGLTAGLLSNLHARKDGNYSSLIFIVQ